MRNCKYKLRKLSIGLVSVGTMLMTTTALGEENTTTTPTAEVTTENQNATSSEIEKEGSSNSKTDEVVEETPAPPGITSTVTTELTETTQNNGEAVDKVQDESLNSIVSGQTEDVKLSSQEQPSLRSKRSTTEVPQTMEVEKLQINKEKSEIRLVDGENGNKKLIANRDGKNREIADISREVKLNDAQDELEVTLKVTPKQIDEGASVIVLLDTSKKMADEDYNTAKENIKKLVATLTANNSNTNENNRNTVRLIDFYRKIGETTDLSGKSDDEIDKKLEELRKNAKDNYNGWGVNLQGAIHKAREIFNLEKEKKSGKRQHIVLFSQGESTFSYDIRKKKEDLSKIQINEPVTYSNPLLPWPFYFDTTTRTHNIVNDAQQLIKFFNKLGITQFNKAVNGIAVTGNTFLGFGNLLGLKNPLDYITMADLDTKGLTELDFNYDKQVGEGYNNRTYSDRKIGSVGMKKILEAKIKENIKKVQPKEANSWLEYFGLKSISEKIQNWTIDKALDNLFYRRQYQFYNHNLSAQAEAKMARDEGIKFYSFDVTNPEVFLKEVKYSGNSKEYRDYQKKNAEKAKELYKKRNDIFDRYLKTMSEGENFLQELSKSENFNDVLSEIVVKESFENVVKLIDKSQYKDDKEVKYTTATSNSSLFSLFFSTATPESLTWTISKEKLKEAFEKRLPLTLAYKLKVDKDKFTPNPRTRAKRSVEATNNNNSVTAKIITSEVSYKINSKSGKATKLDDVTLTFSKELVPVPDIDEEIVIPNIPEKPLVEPEVDSILPLIPLQPSLPIYPTPDLPEMEQPDQDSQEISGQSQIVDIVEDTLPGVSGQQSSSEETEISEDTRPESDNEIIVGGQNELVDIVEDTQPSLSGHQSESQETVTVEDTQPNQTNILIGGQSEIVDIIEDTQAGMTGQYSSTDQLTIVEDTLPEQMEETDEIKADSQVMDIPKVNDTNNDKGAKASVAFDVEESKVVSTQDIKPSTYVKDDNQLPQTGDDDNVNAFFTLAALSVIGAAGLRQNKRREKERN